MEFCRAGVLICSLEQGGLAAKLSQPSVYLLTKPGPKVWGPLEIMDFSVDGWELQTFAVSPRPCSWQEESGQLVSQRLGVLDMNVISEGDGRFSIVRAGGAAGRNSCGQSPLCSFLLCPQSLNMPGV